jgi:NAD(P)-dependent dehydrogenase (short-subunit alcohol dehydrogenase family)/aryl carrier-like protein
MRERTLDAKSRGIADFRLWNDDGEPIAEISGLHFKRLSQGALLASGQGLAQGHAYQVEWRPARRPAAVEPRSDVKPSGAWLILADRGGVGEALAGLLSARGEACRVVHGSEGHAIEALVKDVLGDGGTPCRGIVHLWNLDSTGAAVQDAAGLREAQSTGCTSAVAFVQALIRRGGTHPPRFWAVTSGAQAVSGSERSLSLAQAPIWGLGRTIALEHPEVWGGLVDLDPTDLREHGPSASAELLLAQLTQADGEDQVALRGGQRYVPRLARAARSETPPPRLREDGTYLIVGGLGALGLSVARRLVARGARHLVLTGRRALPERALWSALPPDTDARTRKLITAIEALEQRGARVSLARADVTDVAGMTEVFASIARSGQRLRGIVHAAGVSSPVLFQDLEARSLDTVLRPKVEGAFLLHQLSLGAPLDFFIAFSSIAAVWGGAGLAHYAAANAFLDTLAHHRRALGLPALSINWGPWGAVDVDSEVLSEENQQLLERMGLHALEPEQALDAFEQLMGANATQTVIARVDWSTFKMLYEAKAPRPLFSDIGGSPTGQALGASGPGSDLRGRLDRAPASERADLVRSYLQEQLARALQTNVAEIDPERGLLEMGLDSLMIMEVINRLKRDLGIQLYPREFFEQPSLSALATYIATEFGRMRGDVAPPLPAAAFQPGLLGTALLESAGPIPAPSHRNPTAVFLLSSPRAGSTLLRVMLGGHPALFCPPELHLLPFHRMRDRANALDQSYLDEGLLRALTALHGDNSRELLEGLLAEDATIQRVYGLLQEKAAPRLLVDKSPTYAASPGVLERAEALFEAPRYIHLVRHPYAVIESFLRMRMDKVLKTPQAPPSMLAEQVWASVNRNMLDFRRTAPERHHVIRYEELVRHPEREMRALCGFLGIPFDPKVLTPYEGERMTDGINAQSLGIGDPNFMQHRDIEADLGETWKKIKLPAPLSEFTRRVAAELGYTLPEEERGQPVTSSFAGIAQTIEEGTL